MINQETVDVLVVGAGPVGLTLANLLGVHGVKTLVVEKNDRLEGEPRAVTLDDESLRTMQGAGLSEAVLGEVVLGYGVQYFAWNGKPLAAILPTRQEYGYPKRNAFRQPRLVQTLGQGLQRFAHVEVRFGHELLSIAEDAQGARCELRHSDRRLTVAAKWVVACDGGRSKVRDLLGIKLDGDTYPERWLIVDLADRTVPLRHTSTYCDPRRPAIRLPGPQGALRYEFMLRAEDRDEDVLDESVFRQWIRDRVPQDAALPLVRKAVYGFHARVAARWKKGRVLLAGDAAHLTPPFAGQGLNSGIRDAANLGWKLAAVLKWGAQPDLLDSYEPERRPHASALIRMALRIGAFMQPKTIRGAVLAQTALRALCLIPACRDYILQLRFKPKPQLQRGAFEPSGTHRRSGLIPQPGVELRGGRIERLDAVLGDGFAVLGWDDPAFRAAAHALLPAGAPGRVVALVRAEDDFLGNEPPGAVTRVRDITGELGKTLDALGAVAIVVRPDRYWARLLDAPALGRRRDPAREPAAGAPSAILRTAVVAAGLALASGGAAHAQASAFPSRPVRLITPFAAGSGPDVALRVAAERLSRKWSQPVIVDSYEVASWTGLFAPKGTPKALRERISADLKEALAAPELQQRYRGFDYEAFDAGPDAFAEAIRRETAGWGDIIKAAHLKLD